MALSLHYISPENRNKQMPKNQKNNQCTSLWDRTTLGLHVDRSFNTYNSIDTARREPKIEIEM